MRKIRTMLLVVVAALGAMAFAAPAASADWSNEEGGPLTEEAAFDLAGGYISWEIGMFQTFTCNVEGNVTLQPGDEGEMVTKVIPETCTGGGVWAGCEFASAPAGVSWPLLAQSNSIFANDVTWTWSLEKCSGGSPFNLSFEGDITLTPNNAGWMSSLSISGNGTAKLNGGGSASSKVWGAVEFEESAQGVYGLQG